MKKAFSLVELSIVLIVISLMVVGIVKGGNLVSLARLMNARSFTSNSPVPKISGLLAWYETSMKASLNESEASEDTQITAWYDISPNSIANQRNTLIGLDVAPAPICPVEEPFCTAPPLTNITYQPDGIGKIPSLEFTSSGLATLEKFYQGSSAQLSVFLVFQPSVAPNSTAKILLDSFAGNTTNSVGIKSTALTLNTDTPANATAFSFSSGVNYIVSAYFNGASSKAFSNVADTGADLSLGAGELVGLTIGTDQNYGNSFTGLISEIIIYNRPLKLQERKDVMSYLSKKYQIIVTGL
jgi:prepilin-type N-terminal cleavage/methylation domain-containing protein